jgi:hypothetical protein
VWWHKHERPAPTFEDVLSVAQVLSRINAELIRKQFGVCADAAETFMARLVQENHYNQIGWDGWHYPPARERLRPTRERRREDAKPKADDGMDRNLAADLNKQINELEGEVRALKARIERLQNAGKTVIAQREEWKQRALSAEDFSGEMLDSSAEHEKRFGTLRRLVARELHPDHCDGGDFEKMVRAEYFKRLWPAIERLAEQK